LSGEGAYFHEIHGADYSIAEGIRTHKECAGGGAWAMPYVKERMVDGKFKADQIKATGADLICAPCHNCRDHIMKALTARTAWTGIQTMA